MKQVEVNGYVAPVMVFVTLHNESILCSSLALGGSTNEAINAEEQLIGDITFGW